MYVLRESILHKLNNVLYWHGAVPYEPSFARKKLSRQ